MNAILAVFRLLFLIIAVLISGILWSVVAILFLPSRYYRIRLGNFYGHTIGYLATYWIAGAKVKVANPERLDPERPAIYLMNHTSNLDLFLGVSLHPSKSCGIAKRELVRIPVLGQIWWLSGHLMIDRQNRERAIASMNLLSNLVNKYGLGIWMFPEGTRSPDGKLLKFKKGFVHLAIGTGLPVVPVICSGVHDVWAIGDWKMISNDIDVKILEPIDTSDWKEENINSIIDSVQQVFVEAVAEPQKPDWAKPQLEKPVDEASEQ